jgi:hypothetical protein
MRLRVFALAFSSSFLTIVAAAGCFVSLGTSSPDGDAGAKPKHEAQTPVGEDWRFKWDERIVVDKQTSLTWRRAPLDGWMRLDEGKRACAALDGGIWRVPTRDELVVIAADDESAAALRGVTLDWYWTSTPGAIGRDHAWVVAQGGYLNANRVDAVARVRCVHE